MRANAAFEFVYGQLSVVCQTAVGGISTSSLRSTPSYTGVCTTPEYYYYVPGTSL